MSKGYNNRGCGASMLFITVQAQLVEALISHTFADFNYIVQSDGCDTNHTALNNNSHSKCHLCWYYESVFDIKDTGAEKPLV